MRLYELTDQYQFLLGELYNDETGEINELAQQMLNELDDPIETKCINLTKIFKDLQKDLLAIEKERKAMAAREKAYKNQVAWIKDYLLKNMEQCNISKIECPQFVISLQKNPHSVLLGNREDIPSKYHKITIDYDIQRMKDDMLSGTEVPGAGLIQKNSIRIR